jgi:predicted DNA-binding transcriptional regulator AlpA
MSNEWVRARERARSKSILDRMEVASMATTTIDPLWNADDVAKVLRVPKATLYQWRYLGSGPKASKVGRHLRYDPAEVRAWVKRQETADGQH